MTAPVFPKVPIITYDQAIPCIQSGDILLASGNNWIDKLIKTGTNSQWSHVGMLLDLETDSVNRIMVMESLVTVGVRSVPLTNYVDDHNGTGKPYDGTIMVARYTNFPRDKLDSIIAKSIDLLGYPYSMQDIFAIAGRIALQSVLSATLTEEVSSPKAYICSEYVDACYKAGGIDIPYDPAGYIAPSDFAECKDIVPMFYIQLG